MPAKRNTYLLREGTTSITILSSFYGHQARPNTLHFKQDLDVSYSNGTLCYFSGRPGKGDQIMTVKLVKGKPYKHSYKNSLELTVTISSKDQETFTIGFT